MVVIHEVRVNRPPSIHTDYKNIDYLVALKEETCTDYRYPPDYKALYRECDRLVRQYPYERLKRGREMRDAPLMVELALR